MGSLEVSGGPLGSLLWELFGLPWRSWMAALDLLVAPLGLLVTPCGVQVAPLGLLVAALGLLVAPWGGQCRWM